MATDARAHTVPAGSDAFDPQGSDVALSLSVNDIVIATNATDRASKVTALAPTASRPLFVFQTDTDVLWQHSGTTGVQITVPDASDTGWQSVPLNTGGGVSAYTTSPYNGMYYRVKAGVCYVNGAAVKSGGFPSGTVIGTLPTSARPTVPVDAVSNSSGAQITIRSDGTITAGATLTSPFAMTQVSFPVG